MNVNRALLSVVDKDGREYQIGAVHDVKYARDEQHENGKALVAGVMGGIKIEFKFKMSTRGMMHLVRLVGNGQMLGKLRKRLRYERMMRRRQP